MSTGRIGVFIGCMLCSLLMLFVSSLTLIGQTAPAKPLVVQLSDTSRAYQQVFAGPPQTRSMHAGLVVLQPSQSVGKHSTKSYEEAIVVLSGSGECRITGGPRLPLAAHAVVYCPPNTEHDVANTGSTPLRYLYIAAKPR